MANYVKISSIGGLGKPEIDIETDYQIAVDRMKNLWEKELEKVLHRKPDIIVVPEASDRYSNYPIEKRIEYFKVRKNQIRDYFSRVAKENSCYIAYSAAREMPDGTWRNSTQMIDRTGEIVGIYNKNHPTIREHKNAGILYGKEAPIIECDFGKVAFAICFDLNFDELRLKYVKAKPDIIIFSSLYHGGIMQNYWAYSCRSYFVGCINGVQNTIISPVGELVARSTNYFEYITHTVNLDYVVCHLDYNWIRLDDMKKKYGPAVSVFDPGYLGSVLITSNSNEYSAYEMAKEFEIELLDEYFERCRNDRNIPGNIET